MAHRILEVTLISATDLKDVNLFSKMEVYAVVSISGDPRTRQRTPADRSGGRNPRWNATLRFAVPDPVAGDLRFLLRTERALGDRDVGEVRVPLKELLGGDGGGDAPRSPRVVSYHVRKIGSGKPRGLLNLSYKLADRIAAPAAADEPVMAYPGACRRRRRPCRAASAAYSERPSYGYGAPLYPPPGSYGYPSAAPYGYPPPGYGAAPQRPRRNNLGMGLGAGLLGGALGGLLIGDMFSDGAAYDAGYDAGIGDGGGFDGGFGDGFDGGFGF
ncbi:protein SRC2-like [Ananas comosus]|uniref:Protein SRC2-like n=1 Tax=Ananas comosus TaxID=4615 RepID=A0A6P5GGS7_ANACO|nr:protein SRC2-like [Ananas comosus]